MQLLHSVADLRLRVEGLGEIADAPKREAKGHGLEDNSPALCSVL